MGQPPVTNQFGTPHVANNFIHSQTPVNHLQHNPHHYPTLPDMQGNNQTVPLRCVTDVDVTETL